MSPADIQDNCTREVEVEVAADVVARETETVVEKYRKLARLPGFRKGKTPAGLIRQRFADEIKGEVLDSLVPRYFREEVERRGLAPVSQPKVVDLHLHEGEPLRFKASFEVLPAIEVAGYDELRAEKTEVEVTDEDVVLALNELREQFASYTPVEGRGLADGDFALASFTGTPKEGGGKPVPVNDVLVEIGGTNTVREFSDNLRGALAGEERTFDVAYPADFSDQRLAGKALTYAVKVQAVKSKSLLELNDDFAREVSDLKTFAELKEKLRQRLEAERRHAAEQEAKEKLLDELVRRNDFPVPESLVNRQVDVRVERGLRALAAQGMRTEDMKKMDLGRLRAGQREGALKEVKATLILDVIAVKEQVAVTDEDVDRELVGLAAQTGQTAEVLRARLTREGALDRIRNRIRQEKTLDLLYRRST
ncbi:MAG: trigger factor [Terriglobales bacterium]